MFRLAETAGPAAVIETERLRLRGHRTADFDACMALWSDPLVYRYITGKAGKEGEVWGRILRYIGHWAALGWGYWAVEEKASGQLIGEVGFAEHKREIDPPLTGMAELGWVIGSAHHGKGYGTEAVGAALAWSDPRFGGRRFCCIAAPENTPSLRLATKFGFRQVLHTTYLGDPTILFIREPQKR